MPPALQLLTPELVNRILDEALLLLRDHGVRVQSQAALALLAEGGASVDVANEVAHLPEALVRRALASVPGTFTLYDRTGAPAVTYGSGGVHFDPGSAAVSVLDASSGSHRPAVTGDLVTLVQLAELLPQYDAQSTAVVCSDVPQAIGDVYRLYLVLLHATKPIVTGAFSIEGNARMIAMLSLFRDGREGLARQPLAIFDVCPSPPLTWSAFGAQTLIDLARAGVPAQIVSMPLAGAAAPVTLLGATVQHAAECLSGFVIHQLAQPGAPIVWGGAPAIFDMRHGTTPMGAMETAMLDAAYAQVGRSLGLATHTYLGASDAKVVDAQAGLESGMTALVGALAGIDMISGAGMLDFLACQSAEKLVVDAEAIAMVQRLRQGIAVHTDTLALEMFAGIGFKADFLRQKVTRRLFRAEQHLPSPVIDRATRRTWQEEGAGDTYARAHSRVQELVAAYERPAPTREQEAALRAMMAGLAAEAGMDDLPALG